MAGKYAKKKRPWEGRNQKPTIMKLSRIYPGYYEFHQEVKFTSKLQEANLEHPKTLEC